MSSEAEIHTLAVPYALHALPDDEVALFEEHLAKCGSCRAEVAEVRETATRLGAAESVPPPADLKARVMEQIRQVRPLPPVVAEESDRPDVRPDSVWRRWFPRLAAGLATAATLAAVALGIELYDTRQELDAAHAQTAELSHMLEAEDVEITTMSGDDFGGMVVLSRAQDAAMLMVHGMDAPSGQVYQLWFIDESGARPAGVLSDADDGEMTMHAAHGVGDASSLGMTLEPAGGSDRPTSDPVMMIDLPA